MPERELAEIDNFDLNPKKLPRDGSVAFPFASAVLVPFVLSSLPLCCPFRLADNFAFALFTYPAPNRLEPRLAVLSRAAVSDPRALAPAVSVFTLHVLAQGNKFPGRPPLPTRIAFAWSFTFGPALGVAA